MQVCYSGGGCIHCEVHCLQGSQFQHSILLWPHWRKSNLLAALHHIAIQHNEYACLDNWPKSFFYNIVTVFLSSHGVALVAIYVSTCCITPCMGNGHLHVANLASFPGCKNRGGKHGRRVTCVMSDRREDRHEEGGARSLYCLKL